jgi:hypothetical protein
MGMHAVINPFSARKERYIKVNEHLDLVKQALLFRIPEGL